MNNKWPVLPSFILGCLLCFWGHYYFSLSVVLSSCLVGFVGSFIQSKKNNLWNHCPAAIYSGSFAGMCSSELIQSEYEIILISLLGSVLYYLLIDLFNGIGGKLGTIAFISVALFYLLKGWGDVWIL
jgi:Na+/citrate or Na+/malate symporter|tara:strand:+ start:142671 stop:143051 length:381 start_codon:yes stop_codon:yes gene_type:complete